MSPLLAKPGPRGHNVSYSLVPGLGHSSHSVPQAAPTAQQQASMRNFPGTGWMHSSSSQFRKHCSRRISAGRAQAGLSLSWNTHGTSLYRICSLCASGYLWSVKTLPSPKDPFSRNGSIGLGEASSRKQCMTVGLQAELHWEICHCLEWIPWSQSLREGESGLLADYLTLLTNRNPEKLSWWHGTSVS